MKPVQVNKLYGKLTPREQAALVFEASVRLDESEVDAILENVERKTYRSLHWDYIRRSYGLQSLVSQYGIDYWKNRALMLMAYNLAEERATQKPKTTPCGFLPRLWLWSRRY